jgi:Icc-related predicted phosphoesterase
MHDVLRGLNKPYLAVMGNHDAIANGRDLYKSIYGPFDFSFTLKDIRFIFLNTNGREFNFSNKVPDIDWLNSQLTDTSNFKQVVVICHVFPKSSDFNPDLREPFMKCLSKSGKPVLVVHGHHHNFDYQAADSTGIAFLTASSANKNKYVSLLLWEENHKVTLSP